MSDDYLDLSEDIGEVELAIPPELPTDYSSNEPTQYDHILDSHQSSLTTTSWGNSLNDTLANKPMIMMSREAHFPPEIVYAKMFVTGLSGSGKSYTCGVLMEEFSRLGLQFVCFDSLGAHKGLKQLPNFQNRSSSSESCRFPEQNFKNIFGTGTKI